MPPRTSGSTAPPAVKPWSISTLAQLFRTGKVKHTLGVLLDAELFTKSTDVTRFKSRYSYYFNTLSCIRDDVKLNECKKRHAKLQHVREQEIENIHRYYTDITYVKYQNKIVVIPIRIVTAYLVHLLVDCVVLLQTRQNSAQSVGNMPLNIQYLTRFTKSK